MTRTTTRAAIIIAAALVAAGCASQPQATNTPPPATAPSPETTLDASTGSGTGENTDVRALSDVTVSMQVDGQSFTITLYDNPTAMSLLDQLPLTVESDDYPGYDEKVLRLDEGLSMEAAPDGDDPLWPEVGWYEPGQWIALYYGHIGYFTGKVPLGTIDATNEQIRDIPGGATITFDIKQD